MVQLTFGLSLVLSSAKALLSHKTNPGNLNSCPSQKSSLVPCCRLGHGHKHIVGIKKSANGRYVRLREGYRKFRTRIQMPPGHGASVGSTRLSGFRLIERE
ncbi:hypothetical protein DFH08DRAFT_902208 [Mycena albidolilacea]|uniref:Secreted protein n=1 Tax=Mycena albidolilacea TaxID=1033008 RepID=A0AAD6Z326_9AGAR|nr:hypothetical protein DFH08DRAFT_902208 [Mycena albidolilacea]